MAVLTWSHACTVGVRAMDDQHGILMDAINELRLAMVRGCGREKVYELFDQIVEFMRMHFWSEEQLLEQTKFEGLEEHRAAHHRILAGLMQSAHRLQYGESLQWRPMLCELHEEFLKHVEEVDQEYGPWLRERGIN